MGSVHELHRSLEWIFCSNLLRRMTHTFSPPMTVIVVGNFVKNGRVLHLNLQIVVRSLHRVYQMNTFK